ncbi:MAG: bifunctional 5,10-methylenetetrahydrofolate dehydrogenase/5,10-methenyltetrahydrofolate cyclohydrolase [Thermotogota bacterium]|nr:bifunctional 5,10-methylenetetrahydrofolate dehydrogenase/5,10-methenyltetrahydrofolate cyclohydrolase [Thermotogota bacterium]
MILSGKEVAKAIKKKIAEEIEQCESTPHLITISVAPDPSTRSYINSQTKAAKKLGIDHTHRELEASSGMEKLIEVIKESNCDDSVDGILLALPLPDGYDKLKAINHIDPEKDVEGITTINLGLLFYEKPFYYPCTAQAVLEILNHYNIQVAKKDITIIGRSTTVGKPLDLMLLEKSNNGTPTICHTRTADLPQKIKDAKILIVAAGKHGVVDIAMLSDNTVVIDVGINFIDGKLVGDVKRDKKLEEEKNISITPVPGGVGTVTTTILMSNVVSRCLSKTKK